MASFKAIIASNIAISASFLGWAGRPGRAERLQVLLQRLGGFVEARLVRYRRQRLPPPNARAHIDAGAPISIPLVFGYARTCAERITRTFCGPPVSGLDR